MSREYKKGGPDPTPQQFRSALAVVLCIIGGAIFVIYALFQNFF